uniref:Uncharacterized protein n=1 Tax=Timema shepardi TaxID=629360 RepID=A0A7R9B3L1_TIMSH|nr:unnamed protein product [Timema shepardi]
MIRKIMCLSAITSDSQHLGGYNLANTARYWTYLTSILLDQKIPSEIPEHRYFTSYGPDFDLHITPGCRRDFNTKEYIEDVIKIIHKNLDDMVSLPTGDVYSRALKRQDASEELWSKFYSVKDFVEQTDIKKKQASIMDFQEMGFILSELIREECEMRNTTS